MWHTLNKVRNIFTSCIMSSAEVYLDGHSCCNVCLWRVVSFLTSINCGCICVWFARITVLVSIISNTAQVNVTVQPTGNISWCELKQSNVIKRWEIVVIRFWRNFIVWIFSKPKLVWISDTLQVCRCLQIVLISVNHWRITNVLDTLQGIHNYVGILSAALNVKRNDWTLWRLHLW